MGVKLAGKEELCRNLELQINELKQSAIKSESKITQLKKTIDSKDEEVKRWDLNCRLKFGRFSVA